MRNFKEEKNLNHYEFFVQKEGLTDNKTYWIKIMYLLIAFIDASSHKQGASYS